MNREGSRGQILGRLPGEPSLRKAEVGLVWRRLAFFRAVGLLIGGSMKRLEAAQGSVLASLVVAIHF